MRSSFQLEDDGGQTVVSAHYGHARRSYPVAVVEKFGSGIVGQSEDILVDGLSGFFAEMVGFCVVGKKNVAGLHHGTGTKALHAVFAGEFLIECRFQNGDSDPFHGKGSLQGGRNSPMTR